MDFDSYFSWLRSKVDPFDMAGCHDVLLKALFNKEAYAVHPMDQNRIKDGLLFREAYFGEIMPNRFFPYSEQAEVIYSVPCSCLEFLMGLANRMNFAYAYPYEDFFSDFFWELLSNVGMPFDKYRDDSLDHNSLNRIAENMDRVLERQYGADGIGGLFPLKNSPQNQRNQELWYQMNAYVMEKKEANGRT